MRSKLCKNDVYSIQSLILSHFFHQIFQFLPISGIIPLSGIYLLKCIFWLKLSTNLLNEYVAIFSIIFADFIEMIVMTMTKNTPKKYWFYAVSLIILQGLIFADFVDPGILFILKTNLICNQVCLVGINLKTLWGGGGKHCFCNNSENIFWQ